MEKWKSGELYWIKMAAQDVVFSRESYYSRVKLLQKILSDRTWESIRSKLKREVKQIQGE